MERSVYEEATGPSKCHQHNISNCFLILSQAFSLSSFFEKLKVVLQNPNNGKEYTYLLTAQTIKILSQNCSG